MTEKGPVYHKGKETLTHEERAFLYALCLKGIRIDELDILNETLNITSRATGVKFVGRRVVIVTNGDEDGM